MVHKPNKGSSANSKQQASGIQRSISKTQYPKSEYHASRTKDFDLLHTKLEVSFDWKKQYLHGIAALSIKPYFYPQNILELDAKGFDIHSITLVRPLSAGKGAGKWSDEYNSTNTEELKYEYDSLIIKIFLDKTYTRDETLLVRIDYTAKPNELPEGGSVAIHSDKGLYFVNPDGKEPNKPRQIWTQGEPESNSCWFPTIDSPNEKMTQEIYITIDTSFTTLSNGSLIYSKINEDGTKTEYWKQDLPHSPYLTMMAIGEFAVVKDHWQDIEVNYYVEPEYARYAKNIFGNTPEMIEFFSNKLGYKYPWDKYSQVVVRDYVSGAMENTTATILMEDVQVDNRELLDHNWDDIIAHELFHHWFGDLVTCESWANLPLNEAFATYSEYLWAEYKYGTDEADYILQNELKHYLYEARRKQVPLIRYHYRSKDAMFDGHTYAKGSRILHMLRKYVGDDAFFESLKLYLHTHKFTDVEIHDLRIAFEKVTGEDLNWFFNGWFFSPGHPVIRVEHQFVAGRGAIGDNPTTSNGTLVLKVWQNQDSANTPIYRLPLVVDIWVDGKKQRHEIEITKAYQEFEFEVDEVPDLVLFDGEQQLTGEITHPKSTDELIFQYYNSDKYLARNEAIKLALPPTSNSYRPAPNQRSRRPGNTSGNSNGGVGIDNPDIRAMIVKALNDRFWRLRKMAVSFFKDYSGEDAPVIYNIIKNLALSDSASGVRSEAISVLGSIPILPAGAQADDLKDIFIKGMKDSAYSVVSASLRAYVNTDAVDIEDKLIEFEKYKQEDIVETIVEYYAKQGEASKYEWFIEKIEKNEEELYTIVSYFGNYLVNLFEDGVTKPNLQKDSLQRSGIKILENIARNSDLIYLRLTAYQSLGFLKEVEGVIELRNNIKEDESNEHLRLLYNLIP